MSLAGPADATTANCTAGDAPVPYNNVTSCNGVCTEASGEWLCSMSTLCTTGGAQAYVVRDASIGHDLVAFGGCVGGGNDFCCTFDEDAIAPITTVRLTGTDYRDEPLAFSHDVGQLTELNLYPWDSDSITGVIRARVGNDILFGSNYGNTDYSESLYGMNGSDELDSLGGADFLYGGFQDDLLEGGDGTDVLVGGDGDDELYGGESADVLCDTTGESFCATSGVQVLDGGLGDDTLWYDENPTCVNRLLDTTNSTGDLGTNTCGDDNDWTYAEMPLECDNFLVVEPVECIVP